MVLIVRRIAIFVVPVVMLLLSACGSVPRRQITTMLNDIETYINDHPDSALAVLQAIDSTALGTRALQARYSLLRVMALDKCYEDITAPGLLDPAVAWYERHGSADEKMKTLYYQGRIAQDNKDPNGAAVLYARAEVYADNVSDMHALGLLYLAESAVYEGRYNAAKEGELIGKSLDVFKRANDTMYESVLGDLALYYHKNSEWDKADSLYRTGIAHSENYPFALSMYLSNFARMKVQQPDKDPEGAITLLNRKYALSGSLTPQEAGAYAYSLALTGRTKAADQIRMQLEEKTGKDRYEVLPWLRRMAVLRGDFQQAYSYQAEIHNEEETLVLESLEDSVTQALQEYYAQASLHERERRLRLGVWTLAIIVILMSLAVFLILRNRSIRFERDRLMSIRADLEYDLHRQETLATTLSDSLSSRLAQLRIQLREEHLERLRRSGRYGYEIWMAGKGRSSNAEIVNRLRKDVQYICALEKDYCELERRIDEDLDGLYSRLVEDLAISDRPDEQRFLCYWLIDLKPDMIAELLNTTVNNIYVKSHRLKERIYALNKADYSALV